MTDHAFAAARDSTKIDLTISKLRIFRLRSDDEAQLPLRVVAHVEANSESSPVSVFGRVAIANPAEELHVRGRAWEVTEDLLSEFVGRSLAGLSEENLNDSVAPIFEAFTRKAEASHNQEMSSREGRTRRPVERSARRLVRRALNLLKRRPLNTRPEREPSKLVGTEAVRLALVGAIANITTGERYGEPNGGVWFVGGLEDFYDDNVQSINSYAVAPVPAAPSIDGREANSFPDAEYIEPLPKDGTKGHLLEREALRYGLTSVRYPNGAFVVSDQDGRQMNFKWGRSPIASGVALSICSYKEATRRLLKRVDVPVPLGRVFSISDVDKAYDYADRIGYPVVCKPVAGLRGIGVIADIRSRESLVRALDLYTRSELGSDDFVIEEHVPGEDYRIVVIDGEVVAAVVREPASVEGDGIHTVADLVEYKNRARLRNPHLSSRLVKFSESMQYQLAEASMRLGSVPAAGERVLLANSANLSQGGDSFEVGHELHSSVVEAAVRAVEAVPGLGFCGLDMLIEDHRRPLAEQRATVIELNAHAAIGSAQYPMWGTPAPVAQSLFRAAAADYGIELPGERAEQLSVEVVVRGKVIGVGYRRWLRRRASRSGVSGGVTNTGRREVTARLQGSSDAVSALVYLAAAGPRRALPSSVSTTHVALTEAQGFQINYERKAGRGSRLWTLAARVCSVL